MTLDQRLNAVRGDLADARLRDRVAAPCYVEGRPARVAVGVAAVRERPDPQAATATFYHYGERVLVFDTGPGYAWCQSLRDSYVGYVEAATLDTAPGPTPTDIVATLGSYRYEAADLRSPVIDFLPRHSAVAVAETGLQCRGTAYARLADGGFVPAACVAAEPPRSLDLAAAASLYLGCPYLWGGRSFLGLDCSGLVQEACRDLGLAVPRDTDLQRAAVGEAVALADPLEIRRNDLLYLPGHVLIAAGDGAVIHADGATMMVRRDPLAALMAMRGWRLADFAVRRLG